MENVLNILKQIKPTVDWEQADELYKKGLIDSYDILTIVEELNDTLGAHIRQTDITAENFRSAASIASLVEKSMP